MFSMNKVILIGNLGKTPETGRTNNGNLYAKASLATASSWKDKDGKRQDHTEWHNIVMFGSNAKYASEYLKKGDQVQIEGHLRTRKYEPTPGDVRFFTEVIVDQIRGQARPVSKASEPAARSEPAALAPAQSPAASAATSPASVAASSNDFEDDIPF